MKKQTETKRSPEWSIAAPDTEIPEREPGYTQIPWEKWERQQAEKVAWVGQLEEEK
jgi:hypothetical protein